MMNIQRQGLLLVEVLFFFSLKKHLPTGIAENCVVSLIKVNFENQGMLELPLNDSFLPE